MGTLGFQELLLIGVIALLVLGPERLPEMARQAARALARLRQETRASLDELKQAADVSDLDRELRGLGRDLRAAGRSVRDTLSAEVEGGGAARPDDRPPPTDPDAT